ncbi:hypothetical protein Y032_0252g247 [Ancylostoma ceylanicum]|uniref:Leishmanolysin-like peptidase n=2 Tax=Ancylostoma ceylanicum TaxID=53326 RepID=A0A016SCZ1_9BILA|nr:hypothetical protein Y032_0252g247 [Ancylostoma ceylanicum]
MVLKRLISQARDYFEDTLKVERVRNLRLTPECTGNMWLGDGNSVVCELDCHARCGTATVPPGTPIFAKCTCKDRRCFRSFDKYEGSINYADFVLFVAVNRGICSDFTLAYAARCNMHPITKRPISGYVNICPSAFNAMQRNEMSQWLSTIKHELIHAFVFSTSHFQNYVGAKPPIQKKPIPIVPGIIEKFTRPDWETSKGKSSHDVYMIVTPKVREEARKYFHCDSLEGAEIENQGGSGTSGSHWEKRVFENEAMSGVATQVYAVSRLTLALFEDSGWYKVNYHSTVNVAYTPMPLEDQCPPFLESEVSAALRTMKTGRTPGHNHITTEMLKWSERSLVPRFTGLFNQCLYSGLVPEKMADSITILLHKKGDSADLKNYRPISLLSVLYKLLTKVINQRIENILDAEQSREQAGFRKGYSTVDHLHAMNELIERSNEYQMPLFIAFIDYEKAFDTVETNSLWNVLQEQGVHVQIISLLQGIYTNAQSLIRLGETIIPIKVCRGVRQGDTISPKLFTATLEHVLRKMEWNDYGVSVNGNQLTNLRFADDVVLIAKSAQELQAMMTDLDKHSLDYGLKISDSKTKIILPDSFRKAENMTWGKGLGCDFVKKSCLSWMRSPQGPYPFCTQEYDMRCNADRKSKVSCNLIRSASRVTADYDYNSPNLYKDEKNRAIVAYGQEQIADYCPYYRVFGEISKEATDTRCTYSGNMYYNNYSLEIFSRSARCFSLEEGIKVKKKLQRTTYNMKVGCYETSCKGNRLHIKMQSSKFYPCYHAGQFIHVEKVWILV